MRAVLVAFIVWLSLCAIAAPSYSGEKEKLSSVKTHLGYPFPYLVGSFWRVDYQVHEEEAPGLGAGASYSIGQDSSVTVSVFAYPSPRDAQGKQLSFSDHYAKEQRDVLNYYADAHVAPWPISIGQDLREGIPVRHGAFSFEDEFEQELVSLLSLYDYGETRLKLRINYHPADPKAPAMISDFYKIYPFPEPRADRRRITNP